MATQTPKERADASQARLDKRQQGINTNLNNRTNNARNNLNARDSRKINQLVGDLLTLGPEQPSPTLRKEEKRGPIPAARGYAERAYQPGTGGDGISGNLVEKEDSREYHPAQVVIPADGYFAYSTRAVKKLYFNGLTLQLQPPTYDDP